jgi:hypothetical protein
VNVTEAEVEKLVSEAFEQQVEKIKEKGYNYKGPFQGQLRKVPGLKFAPPEFVVAAADKVFEG